MFTIKKLVAVESLDEAYLLNQARSNAVLGGILWMKMGNKAISKAIDLSRLELDQIEENDEEFIIGCMSTLRDIEVHQGLNSYFNGIIGQSVKHIVGTQFRNCATIGGSIFSRFGFSDLLTSLLALDTYVELYQGGTVPLEKFIKMPVDNDILVHIIIRKNERSGAYLSHRNTKTDFPTLAVAVSRLDDKWRIAIGARPAKAMLVKSAKELSKEPTKEEIRDFMVKVHSEVPFGSNMRGSAQYREILSDVLIERCIKMILGGNK